LKKFNAANFFDRARLKLVIERHPAVQKKVQPMLFSINPMQEYMKLESNWSKLERSTQKYEHLYLGARVHHKQTNLGGVSEDNNISNHDFKIVIEFTCTPMLTYKRRLSNGAFNLIEAIYKDYKMTDRLEKKTNAVAPQLWHFPPINPLESSPFLRTLPEPRTWQRLRFLPFCLWGIPKKCPRVQSEENKKL